MFAILLDAVVFLIGHRFAVGATKVWSFAVCSDFEKIIPSCK